MGPRVQGQDEGGGGKVASLGPYLLARKGGARPAMRSSQQFGETAEAIDDLGWNDIGEDRPAAEPEVKRQQARLLHRVADANLAAMQPVAPRTESEADRSARRAAFTLRLDEERHLRLRMASTVAGESAQNLVTRALDEFLARHPDIEHLAAQVRNRGPRGSGQPA